MVRDDYNKQGGKGNERSHRYSVERKTKNAPGKTSNYEYVFVLNKILSIQISRQFILLISF